MKRRSEVLAGDGLHTGVARHTGHVVKQALFRLLKDGCGIRRLLAQAE
jgi:hypothetical protein